MEHEPLSPNARDTSRGAKKSARIAPQSSRGGGGGGGGFGGGGSPTKQRPVSARAPNSSRRNDYLAMPPAPYTRPQIQPSAYAQQPPRRPNSGVDPRKRWPAWHGSAVPTGGGGATGSDSSAGSGGTSRRSPGTARTPRSAALAGSLSSSKGGGAGNDLVADAFPGLTGAWDPTPSAVLSAGGRECVDYLKRHGEASAELAEAALGRIGSHCHSAPMPIPA